MSLETLFAILVVVLLGWYLSFLASRLDRLHHRVETSWATLDSLLQKRAALAHEIVSESNLDPATAYLISSSAVNARRPTQGAFCGGECVIRIFKISSGFSR